MIPRCAENVREVGGYGVGTRKKWKERCAMYRAEDCGARLLLNGALLLEDIVDFLLHFCLVEHFIEIVGELFAFLEDHRSFLQ